MEANIKNTIMAVPMSGCLAIRIKGTKIRTEGQIKPFMDNPLRGILIVLKYLAKIIIMASFANSDG
jgi:hypothetical protein